MNLYRKLSLLALAWIGCCLVPSTQAGVIACQPGTLPLVTNTVSCEKGAATQDFLNTNPSTVNQEAFFGFTDWTYLTRNDLGEGQSGQWSVDSSIWNQYSDLLLVFKSGKDTTLLGFLVADGATGGSWQSPFREPEFDFNPDHKIKDVSHITYYVRGIATSVPESSSILLLGLGLISLLVMRRR